MKQLPNIQRFMTKDRAVLMFCIGIAACLWFLNKLSNSSKRTLSVEVAYQLPIGKALSTPPPQYIQLTVQGTGWDLLMANNQSIRVDLTDDSVQVVLFRNAIARQFSTESVTVVPEQTTVFLEEAVSKSVPVKLSADLTFTRGFDLSAPAQMSPAYVNVTGPRSAIQNLEHIETEKITLSKLKEPVDLSLKLVKTPLFYYDVATVSAHLEVEQFTEKTFFLPIKVLNASNNWKMIPNRIRLDCAVPLSRYAQLDTSDFEIEADLRALSANMRRSSVTISLTKQPPFVRYVKYAPSAIRCYLEQ